MTIDKPKILYVEDDPYLSFVTRDNLELKGYQIVVCKDGNEALDVFLTGSFDLCILDVMLPSMDGFTLARKIREASLHIPILFLSAKSLKEDRLTGLRTGGDDYITKPFSIEELILKIEIFLKRSKVEQSNGHRDKNIILGEYTFDSKNLSLIHLGKNLQLTAREADLLLFFANHPNQVTRREDILNSVWGDDSYFNSRSLDVFISRLRKYLGKDKNIRISNIHGVGFKMEIENPEHSNGDSYSINN